MMSEPAPFLPFRCEKLRSDFLTRPCEKNLRRIEALQESWPGGHMGPLEHCLACKGRDLITLEKAPGQEEVEMAGVVAFKNVAEAEKVLRKGKLDDALGEGVSGVVLAHSSPPAETRASADKRFCKNHPEIEQYRGKSGRYTGLCLQCLRERAARNSRNRSRKGAQELPPITEPAEMRKLSAEAIPRMSAAMQPSIHPDLACKNHPDRLARVDRLGRNMRFCNECLADRGHKTGNQNFAASTPPLTIPLNAPEYAELKEWLLAQAAEYERTLPKEIMYRLKLAMREAIDERDICRAPGLS